MKPRSTDAVVVAYLVVGSVVAVVAQTVAASRIGSGLTLRLASPV